MPAAIPAGHPQPPSRLKSPLPPVSRHRALRASACASCTSDAALARLKTSATRVAASPPRAHSHCRRQRLFGQIRLPWARPHPPPPPSASRASPQSRAAAASHRIDAIRGFPPRQTPNSDATAVPPDPAGQHKSRRFPPSRAAPAQRNKGKMKPRHRHCGRMALPTAARASARRRRKEGGRVPAGSSPPVSSKGEGRRESLFICISIW